MGPKGDAPQLRIVRSSRRKCKYDKFRVSNVFQSVQFAKDAAF